MTYPWKGGILSQVQNAVLSQFSLAFIYLVIFDISYVVLGYTKYIIVAEATNLSSWEKITVMSS